MKFILGVLTLAFIIFAWKYTAEKYHECYDKGGVPLTGRIEGMKCVEKDKVIK